MSERELTKTDKEVLQRLPEGWFEWMDILGPIRCPEYRLKRLVDRGVVERRFEGKYPDCEWKYRRME